MKIVRNRYVVMRNNRTEIWGGCAKHFYFKPVSDIGDFQVKSYRSEAQAWASCSSRDENFEVVPVVETIEVLEEINAVPSKQKRKDNVPNRVPRVCSIG